MLGLKGIKTSMRSEANKEYISCDWINSGLEFRKDCIRTCCFAYLQDENASHSMLIDNYDGQSINWEELLEIKRKQKELHKKNKFLPSCKNCIYLETKDWDEEVYIDHLTLNHWSKCNCNCTYCYTASDKKGYNNHKHYFILPILKDMLSKNILRATPRSCITFGGGEPTILEEFEELLDFLLKNNFKNIRINSSGIKYSKSIEKGLKMGAVSLVISPDSGTKQTYEKIKKVNCFDKVWENIRKYTSALENLHLLKVKYIIIPGVNDNKEEIDKWFDLIIKNKVKAVSLSVEQHWYFENNPNFPKHILETIKYIQDKTQQLNLDLEIYCEALSVLKYTTL